MRQKADRDRRPRAHPRAPIGRVAANSLPLAMLQRAIGNRGVARLLGAARATELVKRAAGDPAQKLEPAVRRPLEDRLGKSLGGVRVHSGPASEAAAAALGARAFAVGRDVYTGSEVRSLSTRRRREVMTHEAVHTVQQRGTAVALRDRLRVSSPDEPAEREAAAVARDVTSPGLALRDAMRVSSVAPSVQRDLTDKLPVRNGEFKMNLITQSNPGAKSGLRGTIVFHAADKAPDSTSIRLFQALRIEDLTTGKDYKWTGVDAPRTKTQTKADPSRGIDPGWWIDVDPALTKRRTKKADAPVLPYYREYWKNAASSQDGSKAGKVINDASIWDYPGWSMNSRFSFETVAKDTVGGFVYGSVMWGFTISDASKGKVDHEYAAGRNVTLAETDAALKKFDEYYRNPGASTAPKK